MQFLIDAFTENGYDKNTLRNKGSNDKYTTELRWVLISGPKLHRKFKEKGIRIFFKSSKT